MSKYFSASEAIAATTEFNIKKNKDLSDYEENILANIFDKIKFVSNTGQNKVDFDSNIFTGKILYVLSDLKYRYAMNRTESVITITW